MSANVPKSMLLSDLMKRTGYNCPENLQGKTFAEATSGGDISLEANKAVTIDATEYTEPIEITASAGKDGMAKVTLTLTGL